MRALVVGGGCRGLDLARDLTADGHAHQSSYFSFANRGTVYHGVAFGGCVLCFGA